MKHWVVVLPTKKTVTKYNLKNQISGTAEEADFKIIDANYIGISDGCIIFYAGPEVNITIVAAFSIDKVVGVFEITNSEKKAVGG